MQYSIVHACIAVICVLGPISDIIECLLHLYSYAASGAASLIGSRHAAGRSPAMLTLRADPQTHALLHRPASSLSTPPADTLLSTTRLFAKDEDRVQLVDPALAIDCSGRYTSSYCASFLSAPTGLPKGLIPDDASCCKRRATGLLPSTTAFEIASKASGPRKSTSSLPLAINSSRSRRTSLTTSAAKYGGYNA